MEYITSDGLRSERARVEGFEFDDSGGKIVPMRVVDDGFDGHKCFYSSLVIANVDNGEKNEMVVCTEWTISQK